MSVCQQVNCNKNKVAKGFCQTHYVRFRKHGDPNIVNNKKHGMTRTPEYISWTDMKQRCYNKNKKDYIHYGGRGIKVCSRWLKSFESFYEDMGKRPTDKHSLDRIDNNGDYKPNNCKWSTKSEQNYNQRAKGLSQYVGVYYRKNRNKWVTRFWYRGKIYYFGSFSSEKEAHLARQDGIKKLLQYNSL